MQILVISALLFLSACEPINKFLGLQNDNWMENSVEDAIEFETGAQVDLTPSDKDEGFHLFPRK